MDKAKHIAELYGLAFVAGMVFIPGTKYVLERFGGPIWQDVKSGAYKVWEIAKGLVKRK